MIADAPGSKVPRPWPLPERLERYRSPVVALCLIGGVFRRFVQDCGVGGEAVARDLIDDVEVTLGDLVEIANVVVGDAGGIAVVEAALRGEAPAPTLAGERRRGFLEALAITGEIMSAPNEGRVVDALARALAVECDATDACAVLPALEEPMREALAPVLAALAAQEEAAARDDA